VTFGSQIRSYVFQPYTMVNDHRTELKIPDVQRVMDGDIDPFIEAYLREFAGHGTGGSAAAGPTTSVWDRRRVARGSTRSPQLERHPSRIASTARIMRPKP